jgi:hypothetical protein
VAAITYVSAAVLIVGKLFISAVTTCVAYYLITDNIENELNSVAGPMVLIFLISYWIRYVTLSFGITCQQIHVSRLVSFIMMLPITVSNPFYRIICFYFLLT